MNRVKVVQFDSGKYQFSFTAKIPLTLLQESLFKKGLSAKSSMQSLLVAFYIDRQGIRSGVYLTLEITCLPKAGISSIIPVRDSSIEVSKLETDIFEFYASLIMKSALNF